MEASKINAQIADYIDEVKASLPKGGHRSKNRK
jgi:hypothetical protein